MAGESVEASGFTLVELMVVVLIVGILVTIAVPAYSQATSNAYSRACQANQRMIQTAILTAQSFNEDVSAVGTTPQRFEAGFGWGNVLIPNYIKAAPKCQAPGGGLYMIDPAGVITSDKLAAQSGFVANDHKLPENQ